MTTAFLTLISFYYAIVQVRRRLKGDLDDNLAAKTNLIVKTDNTKEINGNFNNGIAASNGSLNGDVFTINMTNNGSNQGYVNTEDGEAPDRITSAPAPQQNGHGRTSHASDTV